MGLIIYECLPGKVCRDSYGVQSSFRGAVSEVQATLGTQISDGFSEI